MNRINSTWFLAAALSLTVLAGCHEYEAAVEVRPDGSGTRSVTLVPKLDEEITEAELSRFFRVPPEEGWRRETDADGDVVFRLRRDADGPGDWSGLGHDVRVFSRADMGGTVASKGPAGLRNTVSLETGRTEEGRTYTYRERLSWEGLKEDLTAVMTVIYERRVRAAHPDLSEVGVAELRGLFKAHVAQTWDRVYLTDDEDLFLQTLTAALEPDVAELVDRRGLAAETSALVELAADVISDDDHQFESIVERDLTGVAHAMFASLHLEVAMPGEIIDTNGSLDADGRACWNVGLLDPLDRHVELYARSLLRE